MSARVKKSSLLLLIVTAIFLFANVTAVEAVGVRPLVIEMSVRPGDQRTFEIHLTPGTTEELVDLTLYEPVQQLSGSLVYQLPENPAFSATSWVTLDEQVVRVPPDGEGRVTGMLRVPFSASGSHTVIIMVEPRPPEITSGIGFQVRYAVRLSIDVEKAGVRPSAELTHFELSPDQQGAPQFVARFKNTSALNQLVSGEATIRDQERRLVERVTLQTPAGASSSSDATRIYPGAEVNFSGKVTRPLVPGEYSVQIFFRYADGGQILRNETLVIYPGDYTFPGFDELGAIVVNPIVVDHHLRPGENKSQIFEFESLVGTPVRVEIELGEIRSDYKHSLLEWLTLRSQNEFVMPARARTRLAMTIALPRQLEEGSYHGKAIFKVFDANTNDFLHETVVPINVFNGDDLVPTVQVRSVNSQIVGEKEVYISVDLYNNGNVAFSPQISGAIRDEAGEFVERLRFELPEGLDSMLPLHNLQVGAYTYLNEGVYTLELEIGHNTNTILTESHQILVNYSVGEQ